MTWRERVQAARERGGFLPEDRVAAGEWLTCAVGEHHAQYPDVVIYEKHWAFPAPALIPADFALNVLGGNGSHCGFSDAVGRNDFDLAEQLLDQIEDRVLCLKREAGR